MNWPRLIRVADPTEWRKIVLWKGHPLMLEPWTWPPEAFKQCACGTRSRRDSVFTGALMLTP